MGGEFIAWYTLSVYVVNIFVYIPVNSYCHMFNIHTLLLCETAPITHCVIVYGAIYGLVYDVPEFYVHFNACTDIVYQAVFFSSPSKRPENEANTTCTCSVQFSLICQPDVYNVCACVFGGRGGLCVYLM